MTDGTDSGKTTILCPVDFSEPCRVAIDHAEALARGLGAELILAHVVVPAMYPVAFGAVPMGAVTLENEARAAVETSLAQTVKELADRGVECSSLVEVGTPSSRLVEMVRENGVDYVVMGTHGATGLGHVLLGSTAERVVRLCPCPVIAVKIGQPVAD
jgi:universal stress protein A